MSNKKIKTDNLPKPDEVLKRMLNTSLPPKPKKEAKKKPAK
jgi:hypothetical protein